MDNTMLADYGSCENCGEPKPPNRADFKGCCVNCEQWVHITELEKEVQDLKSELNLLRQEMGLI